MLETQVFTMSRMYPYEALFPVEPTGNPESTSMCNTLNSFVVWEKTRSSPATLCYVRFLVFLVIALSLTWSSVSLVDSAYSSCSL